MADANNEELVRYLVTALVDNPDDVRVESRQDASATVIEVHVNEDDLGKVIGRQGRIIKAIRTLTRAAAGDSDQVSVEILE